MMADNIIIYRSSELHFASGLDRSSHVGLRVGIDGQVKLAGQPPLASFLIQSDVLVILQSAPRIMEHVGAGIGDVPDGHKLLLSSRRLLQHFKHDNSPNALVASRNRLDRFLLVVEVNNAEGNHHLDLLDAACLFRNLEMVLGGVRDGVLHLDASWMDGWFVCFGVMTVAFWKQMKTMTRWQHRFVRYFATRERIFATQSCTLL